jgi:hypothetical protein
VCLAFGQAAAGTTYRQACGISALVDCRIRPIKPAAEPSPQPNLRGSLWTKWSCHS